MKKFAVLLLPIIAIGCMTMPDTPEEVRYHSDISYAQGMDFGYIYAIGVLSDETSDIRILGLLNEAEELLNTADKISINQSMEETIRRTIARALSRLADGPTASAPPEVHGWLASDSAWARLQLREWATGLADGIVSGVEEMREQGGDAG